jgi:hypothetical protein
MNRFNRVWIYLFITGGFLVSSGHFNANVGVFKLARISFALGDDTRYTAIIIVVYTITFLNSGSRIRLKIC